jgi:hypothetical protein
MGCGIGLPNRHNWIGDQIAVVVWRSDRRGNLTINPPIGVMSDVVFGKLAFKFV